MVSVDVKHHVYLLTYLQLCCLTSEDIKQREMKTSACVALPAKASKDCYPIYRATCCIAVCIQQPGGLPGQMTHIFIFKEAFGLHLTKFESIVCTCAMVCVCVRARLCRCVYVRACVRVCADRIKSY